MKSHSITLCPFLAKSLNKMIINEMFFTRKTYKPAYTGFESLYKSSIEISYFLVDYRHFSTFFLTFISGEILDTIEVTGSLNAVYLLLNLTYQTMSSLVWLVI